MLNGAKTFISNGQNADLIVVAVRTSPDPHRGLSLLVVESATPGFFRGRNLDKIGLHSQDTSELSFVDARVPAKNLLGEVNRGFYYLVRNLPQERLSLALGAVGAAEGVFDLTLAYTKERFAFGQAIGSFQSSKFTLAELATDIDVGRTYVEDCLFSHLRGALSPGRAAKVKLWTTEMQLRVVDRAVQLFGGYGYMREFPVARAYVDARVQTIYGGTSEIMKEIIAKDLGL
nr:acyl-CoA dehydrogenase family protein [Acidithrix sp. C25]